MLPVLRFDCNICCSENWRCCGYNFQIQVTQYQGVFSLFITACVIHWTRQVKDLLSSKGHGAISENAGPLEEIEYWKNRCADLAGVRKQLESPMVLFIIDMLAHAKSDYVTTFKKQASELKVMHQWKKLFSVKDSQVKWAFDGYRYTAWLVSFISSCKPSSIGMHRWIPFKIPVVYGLVYEKVCFSTFFQYWDGSILSNCIYFIIVLNWHTRWTPLKKV